MIPAARLGRAGRAGLFAGAIGVLSQAACERADRRPPEGLLVLGVVLPLSGPAARTGEDILTGLELATAGEENEPRMLLRVVDGAGAPLQSVERFRELAQDPEVRAVVGGWFASTSRTLGAVSGESGVPLLTLSPLSSGRERAADAFALHRASALAEAAARFAREELGARRAGVVEARDSEVARELADAFRAAFPGDGTSVRWTMSPDAEGRLSLPRGAQPGVDVIWVAGPAEWAVEASDFDVRTRSAAVLTADGWSAGRLEELVEAGIEVYVASFFSPTDPSAPNRRLLEACAGVGREPTAAVALGWDAARLVRHAARVGGDARSEIHAALAGRTSFVGATGRIDFPVGAPSRETPAVSSLTRGGMVFLRRVEVSRSRAQAAGA